MKGGILKQSSLLLLEKLIYSVSRYAVTFYCLKNLTSDHANIFFQQNATLTFLFVACHFGLDNFLIGKLRNGSNVGKWYQLRFSGAVVASILYALVLSIGDSIVIIFLSLALIGVALPIVQTEALVSNSPAKMMKWRLSPEVFSSLIRVYAIHSGTKDAGIILLVFFSSEILSAIINITIYVFRRINQKVNKSEVETSFAINLKDIGPILLGVAIIVLIFAFQRGDVLIWTTLNAGEMSLGLKSVIKSQLFFDMAGILSAAMIPFMLKLEAKKLKYLPVVAVIISLAAGILIVLILENFDSTKLMLVRVLGDFNPILASLFASFGLGTYLIMTQQALNLRQFDILISLLILTLVKLSLFLSIFDEQPVGYSIISSISAFLIFTLMDKVMISRFKRINLFNN